MTDDGTRTPARGSLRRLVWIGLLVFLVLLAGLALLAWLFGDTLLPMEYEGFD
jgi:hypothetical protein